MINETNLPFETTLTNATHISFNDFPSPSCFDVLKKKYIIIKASSVIPAEK